MFRVGPTHSFADVLKRHWAVVAAHTRNGDELILMQQYMRWYGAKVKTLYVDRLFPQTIRSEVAALAGTSELPVLFVNGKCVGTIDVLHRLDSESKLKDVLHFGFIWSDLHTESLRRGPHGRVSQLRPRTKDEAFFLGRYRGAADEPRTVVSLPKFSPQSLDD